MGCVLFIHLPRFQVFILDSLSNYMPKDEREAQSICERITPRLAHANAAVVLSAVKVLMKYMEMMQQVLSTFNWTIFTNLFSFDIRLHYRIKF